MNSHGLVLVVDDTAANLEVISEALSSAGYDVATAINGERALKRSQTHPPDLILLDVQMPGMDGFETCQQLKNNSATAHIPVIFMTALADTESKVKGFTVGAVDYITKPFQMQEVLARVSTHLKLHHLTQDLEAEVAKKAQEHRQAVEQLHQSQLQMMQNEKMLALGNLVAGVAHEINNPLGCIVGNIKATQNYMHDLLGLIDLYAQAFPSPPSNIVAESENIDLVYLREDLPKLIKAMQDGGERIKNISKSLRTFSRSDTESKQKFDLHEGIDSTLLILRHRLKANEVRPAIEVLKEYGSLPMIECFPGQINQVFMNLLANAIDAFDEASQKYSYHDLKSKPNQILIQTYLFDKQVEIAIADNGPGMPHEVKERIFENLFTTKGVGQGTGLGLSIAKQIIVDSHAGRIEVDSAINQGSRFSIFLPLA
jgi:signal transduction histidine kinase